MVRLRATLRASTAFTRTGPHLEESTMRKPTAPSHPARDSSCNPSRLSVEGRGPPRSAGSETALDDHSHRTSIGPLYPTPNHQITPPRTTPNSPRCHQSSPPNRHPPPTLAHPSDPPCQNGAAESAGYVRQARSFTLTQHSTPFAHATTSRYSRSSGLRTPNPPRFSTCV